MIEDQMQYEEAPEGAFFMPEVQQPKKLPAPIAKLEKFIKADNVADFLDEAQLEKIGRRVIDDYEIDKESRSEWEGNYDRWLKMAKLAKEEKSFPWANAANVKLPMIANAAMKFAERAYSEIIRDDRVVKAHIFGQDKDQSKYERAERVSEHMSYQLLEQETEWEPDTDKLLHILAFVGHMFRKRYYDKAQKRMCSEILSPKEIVINAKAKDLVSSRRVSHPITLHSNELYERKTAGVFRDIEYKPEDQENEPDQEKYYEFIEQHRWLDLDGDGYEEPYIVVVERQSYKVAAIAPRYDAESFRLNANETKIQCIDPINYITDYGFIPAFDGSYYYVGYGYLLDALNSTADSIFNMLLDGGTLNNVQGGFLAREVQMKGGVNGFSPGEWKKTNVPAEQLAKGVLPLPTKEPSKTLFELLGLVLEMGKDLSAVKDVLAGDIPSQNVAPTTVMALIEQGTKSFNAIYKRIYRGLHNEFKVQYRLNFHYLDETEYYRIHDQENVIMKQDYALDDCDVIPVADPAMSSDIQRLARAQAMLGGIQLPGVNPKPIVRQFFQALRAENIDEILPEDQGPSPADQMAAKEMELREREVALKEREIAFKEKESGARYEHLITGSIKNVAQAEAAEAGTQMGAYVAIIDSLHRENETEIKRENNARRVSGLGEQPDNTGLLGVDGEGQADMLEQPDPSQLDGLQLGADSPAPIGV